MYLGTMCLVLDLLIIIENYAHYEILVKETKRFMILNIIDIIILLISILYVIIVKNGLLNFSVLFLYPILRIVLYLLQLNSYINSNYEIDNNRKVNSKIFVGICYFFVYAMGLIITLYYLYGIIEKSGYFYAKGSEGMGYLFFDFEIFNILFQLVVLELY